ncbi:hypothetical protein Dimus_019830 [Dionaea muscipula]
MQGSMAHLATYLSIAFVVLLIPELAIARNPTPLYDSLCSIVFNDFLPCMNFLGGQVPDLPKACCSNVKELNTIVASFEHGSRRICQCIEDFEDVMKFRLINSRVQAFASKCNNLTLNFPISVSKNCSIPSNI